MVILHPPAKVELGLYAALQPAHDIADPVVAKMNQIIPDDNFRHGDAPLSEFVLPEDGRRLTAEGCACLRTGAAVVNELPAGGHEP